jgi:hypothetical protein
MRSLNAAPPRRCYENRRKSLRIRCTSLDKKRLFSFSVASRRLMTLCAERLCLSGPSPLIISHPPRPEGIAFRAGRMRLVSISAPRKGAAFPHRRPCAFGAPPTMKMGVLEKEWKDAGQVRYKPTWRAEAWRPRFAVVTASRRTDWPAPCKGTTVRRSRIPGRTHNSFCNRPAAQPRFSTEALWK